MISQGDPEFQGVTDKLLGKKATVHPFQGFNPRVQQDVNSIIKDIKNMEPVTAMKEANSVIGRKGRYKNLSGDEAQRILKETEDHIFQRGVDDLPLDDFASGGRVPLMYGGDPGFAFEYGGSWADWHDQHRDQMPVEQYIKTKLPKHRLPFREMQTGGIARVKFNQGKEGELFGIPMEDIKKYQEKKRRGEIMDRTSPLAIPDDWLERLLRKFRRTETYEQSMQEGGLAYMLGEPTYSVGGSVGHAPWHKPTGHKQPEAQQETPTPHVAGRPDPLKAPRGIPSLAPKNMDPAYMQQQMMQKAMMGQGPRPMANEGGRIGFDKGKKVDLSKRRFLKGAGAGIGLLSMLPFVGKFFKAAKVAKPAAAVTEYDY